jgi:hypothetical protein
VQYVNHAPQARILADKADVKWGGESSIAAAIEVLERRGARQNRVATMGPCQRRAARRAFGKVRQAEKPQPRLHPVASGEVGLRNSIGCASAHISAILAWPRCAMVQSPV